MVAEMTGTLSLIVPAMLAVGLATLIVRRNDDTIYRSQLRSRPSPLRTVSSPVFHCSRSRLRHRPMAPARCVLAEPGDSAKFQAQMEHDEVSAAPLVDAQGRYVGVVTWRRWRKVTGGAEAPSVEGLVDATFAPIHESVHLDVVLDTLTSTPQTWAAVIDDERRVVGTIAVTDIVRNYRRTMQANLRRVSELGGSLESWR